MDAGGLEGEVLRICLTGEKATRSQALARPSKGKEEGKTSGSRCRCAIKREKRRFNGAFGF